MWLIFAAVCNFVVLGIVGIAAVIGISQRVTTNSYKTIVPIVDSYTPSATPTSTELPCKLKVPKEYWDKYCSDFKD